MPVTGPPPATAAVRVAVRRALADLSPDAPVAAAVSGGADSLALAAGLAFLRPGACALVVDHGLQPGSADVAARAGGQCRRLGLSAAVLVAPASSDRQRVHAGDPTKTPGAGRGGGGPEARARQLRYDALAAAGDRLGLAAVLLGHTLDDQAETVLLGLARGAGSRSLAGMADRRGRYRRPLLSLDRATTRAACAEAGLTPWDDPHNADPSYARVRARTALPALDRALGPGTAQALSRTARQLREDADALDALAADVPLTDQLDIARLAALPAAVRSRVLKRWAQRACGRAVTSVHVQAMRALVDDWHGQGPIALPGRVQVRRSAGVLVVRPDATAQRRTQS